MPSPSLGTAAIVVAVPVGLGAIMKLADWWNSITRPKVTRLSVKAPSHLTPEYQLYIASAAWRQRRQSILVRAKGHCEECKKRRPLQVHHLTYARLGAELDSDLIALCQACHQGKHSHQIGGVSQTRGCPLTVLTWTALLALVLLACERL